MTGHDGNVSPPAPMRAGTGTGNSSAVAAGAGAGDGGRSMEWDKELALACSSSAVVVGSPPHPSKSLKSREAKVQGGKKKWNMAVFSTFHECWECRLCWKRFQSPNAVNGHQHVHKRRLKIHMKLDLNKTPQDAENHDEKSA